MNSIHSLIQACATANRVSRPIAPIPNRSITGGPRLELLQIDADQGLGQPSSQPLRKRNGDEPAVDNSDNISSKRLRIYRPRAAASSKRSHENLELRRQIIWYIEQIRKREQQIKAIEMTRGNEMGQDEMVQQEQLFVPLQSQMENSRTEQNATSARVHDLEVVVTIFFTPFLQEFILIRFP